MKKKHGIRKIFILSISIILAVVAIAALFVELIPDNKTGKDSNRNLLHSFSPSIDLDSKFNGENEICQVATQYSNIGSIMQMQGMWCSANMAQMKKTSWQTIILLFLCRS